MISIVLLLWCGITTNATVIGEEQIVSLSMSEGLAGETVFKVMTAHDGTIWIATTNGINIFNGKQMVTIPVYDEEGHTVAVHDMCETKSHVIYAATDNGLYYINGAMGRFAHMLPEVQQPISVLAVGDTVYIGSQQGIQFYDGHQLHRIDVAVSHQGLDNVVRQYVRGDDGLIWFLGRYDLNSYDPRTGKVVYYHLELGDNHHALSQFAYIGQKRFVIGTRISGLFVCDLQTGTTEQIEGVGNIVSTTQRSADGNICVATDGSGAYLLDGETLKIKEHFSMEADGAHRLPSNGTYCYYRDANGVNWLGMVRYGLAYTYYSGHLFKPFRAGDFTTEGLNVRCFCQHGEDAVFGTQNGFYYVNLSTGQYRYFSPSEIGGGHIVNVLEWYDGHFYIGTFDGGLRIFDPTTQTVRRQTASPLLDYGSIGDIKAGPDGRLWIGSTEGLIIVAEGKVQQRFTEQNSRIVGGLILDITFDASGNAWVTGEKGCSLYSVRSREIVETNFPKGFFNKQPWMRGALGHDGLIFMRTGPHTFFTNEQMTDYGELKLPITFVDKWCRSFVDDMEGHYLLTSERGVVCFDYDMKEMIHFGYGEGLRGDFINDMSLAKDGLLWVATSQGLYYSNLDSLKSWKKDACHKVRLYNIRRGSDLLNIAEEYQANEEHAIRLTWNMTSQVLQAVSILLDYSKQTCRLYEYRLGGGNWTLVEDGQPIYVKRLFLGQHRLEVRLAGAEGTSSFYTITVVPSLLFIFELMLFIVAMVLLWLWWRFRKNTRVLLTERDEIEDALIEMEQQEELLAERQEEAEETGGNKYQQVKMTDEECNDIVSRMRQYLETEQAYTNSDLKRADLARVLHVPVTKLSYVFSMYLNENYYEFVNRYRLERFKQLIAEGANKRFTLTALSEQCGFRKSSFFSTFRKVEGMTPTEYLKQHNIKIALS